MLEIGMFNCSQTPDVIIDEVTPIRQATMLTWKVGMPLVMVLGTFGNIMILLIQWREYSASHSSMSVFFTCLAISDLTSLWFDPLFSFLQVLDVFVYYAFLWKIRMFVNYVTGHVSPSILVTMTVQKAVSILWPHKVKVVFTTGFAKTLMISLLTFFVLINSHLLYGITVILPSNISLATCFDSFVSIEYAVFFFSIWSWVDTILSSLGPVLLLLVSNSVLIWKVGQSLQEARKRFSAGNTHRLRAREKKTSSMTVTLIATSVTFLLLTSPLVLYIIFLDRFMEGANGDQYIADIKGFVLAAFHLLWIGNNAMNFYLYCLTGAKYREKFLNLIRLNVFHHRVDEKSTQLSVAFTTED